MSNLKKQARTEAIRKAREYDIENSDEPFITALSATESLALYYFLDDVGYISHEFHSGVHDIHTSLKNSLKSLGIINV